MLVAPGLFRRNGPTLVVVTFFLVVPLTVLVYWTVRGVELGHGIAFAWEAAFSSVLPGAW